MYNAFKENLEDFSLPKARENGEMPTVFTQYALNESTGTAEGFMEFQEQVWSHQIQSQWEQLGAASVTVLTFQNNDGNHSAASALNRVTKLASSPGFKLITTGSCNPKLQAKAKELAEKEHVKLNTTTEFDEKTQAVIKQSLAVAERISESMVTKKELQDLGESSQRSSDELKCRVVEINEKITQDYEDAIKSQSSIISKQSVTISKLQSALEAKGKDMEAKQKEIDSLAKKNHSQSVVIAKLNTERDNAVKKFENLQQNSYPRGKLMEDMTHMRRKLDDLWEESKRRRRV